jgi:SAM-dependent methyltransferase
MKTEHKHAESVSACPDAAAHVHDKVISLLLTEKPGDLLDAPAGEGAFAVRAHDLGYAVRCGDLDVSRFKAKGIECDRLDLNTRWPYDDHRFDYVVAIEAIEHLENPWHIAREANRVLKPGGKLIMTTPNILTIKSRLSYLLYGYPNYFHYMVERHPDHGDESPIDHINPVSFLELRHVLSRNGLQIEAIETNRYAKRHSLFYQLLRLLLHSRGRSHVRNDQAKAGVREALLSAVLLFGEILVLKARKVAEVCAHEPSVHLQG